MRVRFDDLDVFDCGDRGIYDQLQKLFLRVYRGQHEIEIDDPEAVLASEFMSVACAAMHRPHWEELLRRSPGDPFAPADKPERRAVVTQRQGEPDDVVAFRIAPEKAGDWAEQPLRVLLENIRDAVLIRLAAHVSASVPVHAALEEGWLEPEGCGGTGEVQRAIESARHPQRLFVIIDSDRDEFGGEPSEKARRIDSACARASIPVHVLERRELENYVPERIWQDIVGVRIGGKRSGTGSDQRAVLVYRWLMKRLEEQDQAIAKKYGRDALDKVLMEIRQQAEKDLSPRLLQDLLAEWRSLGPLKGQRHVDDLKFRFGKKLAAEAVRRMSLAGFDLGLLDDEARAELGALAAKLEEWL